MPQVLVYPTMNDQERKRVHINHCVSGDEQARAASLCEAADPGAWRVLRGAVVRFSGEPLSEKSLPLMAESVVLVPRLLRGIQALEDALTTAWAGIEVWKREYQREQDRHRQTALRAGEARQADGGLKAIAELLKLSGEEHLPRAADLIARWQGGEDVASYLESELAWLRKAAADREEARQKQAESDRAVVREAQAIIEGKRKRG